MYRVAILSAACLYGVHKYNHHVKRETFRKKENEFIEAYEKAGYEGIRLAYDKASRIEMYYCENQDTERDPIEYTLDLHFRDDKGHIICSYEKVHNEYPGIPLEELGKFTYFTQDGSGYYTWYGDHLLCFNRMFRV